MLRTSSLIIRSRCKVPMMRGLPPFRMAPANISRTALRALSVDASKPESKPIVSPSANANANASGNASASIPMGSKQKKSKTSDDSETESLNKNVFRVLMVCGIGMTGYIGYTNRDKIRGFFSKDHEWSDVKILTTSSDKKDVPVSSVVLTHYKGKVKHGVETIYVPLIPKDGKISDETKLHLGQEITYAEGKVVTTGPLYELSAPKPGVTPQTVGSLRAKKVTPPVSSSTTVLPVSASNGNHLVTHADQAKVSK